MAASSSTALHQYEDDIELPRYRGRSKSTKQADSKTDDVQRADWSPSSSSTRLDHDTETTSTIVGANSPALQQSVVKTLIFVRPVFRSDMTIQNASGPIAIPLYHAATTEWNFTRPDVTLHAGGDRSGSVLAVAHFRWSRDVRMGIGDPSAGVGVVWEEMRNTSSYYGHSKYVFAFSDQQRPDKFSLELPSASSGQRRHLMWQRTTAAAFGETGWCAWLSRRHYRLVDLETGDVVAVFLANNVDSLTKKGELRMFAHVSKELETVIVLTMACISEKTTRRVRHQHSGGGGGGP